MKALIAGLTVKPLLYAVGALLAAIVVMSAAWYISARSAAADLSVAQAAADSANALLRTERTRTSELASANEGWQKTTGVLQAELKAAQDQVADIRQKSDAAVAAAQARAADANKTLKTFMDRYAVQVREPHCASALQQLEAACPAFSGY